MNIFVINYPLKSENDKCIYYGEFKDRETTISYINTPKFREEIRLYGNDMLIVFFPSDFDIGKDEIIDRINELECFSYSFKLCEEYRNELNIKYLYSLR